MSAKHLAFAVLVVASTVLAEREAGLIQSGTDTLHLLREQGFDLVTATACTTTSVVDRTCVHHFMFDWTSKEDYRLMAGLEDRGLGYSLGKLNLDSVKTAPSDSVFGARGRYTMDSIPPNALGSRIGNVYVMKTGTDPRVHFPFYAKIKILKFIVHDSAAHKIDMVFLWVCNESGYTDLHSAVDTFRLDSTPVANAPSALSRARPALSRVAAQTMLRVGRSGVVVAGERGGVWDLRGRKADFRLTNGDLRLKGGSGNLER